MTAITLRIPDAMDKQLRDAAADNSLRALLDL